MAGIRVSVASSDEPPELTEGVRVSATAIAEPAELTEGPSLEGVWFEFLSSDRSAIPVRLTGAASMGEELGDRLLWRPGAGLEGWTPMREVLENSQRSGSQVSTPSRPSGVHVTDDPSSRGSQQDSLAEGEPTNLRRWRPLFGLPLEACECEL